jgi:hypothetical protein
MIKKILYLLFCLTFTFGLIACESGGGSADNGEDTAVYDYTLANLKVEQEQSFAPCSFFNFIYGNKHARNYYYESLSVPLNQVTWDYVKIDGEKWSNSFLEKLPEGKYVLEVRALIPYSEVQSKTFEVKVNVSKNNQDITGGIDYLAETLKLTERQVCEQTNLRGFLQSNFHCGAYLWYPLSSAIYASPWEYVLVNGVEWSVIDQVTKELPIGTYDIKIKVSEDFKVRKVDKIGLVIEVAYPSTLTIPVKIKSKTA